MIHIPLHKTTVESILETLNLNTDSFDAANLESSDLLALTKRIEPNLDEIYNDFAVISISEVELEWFTRGLTKGFDESENPALFLMQKIQWGEVDRDNSDEEENEEVKIHGTPYDGEVEGYCVHCKDTRIIENCHISIAESGRKMYSGICPECLTRMGKIREA